ncbi:MAG: DUF2089 domain-containing protein [Candidatus Wallbacteria bacterium]|nr:DUF2089 domain-containing protein [Candidatus Wallbacteria bacterium]
MNDKILPHACPACESDLQIVRLKCPECGTEVSGQFIPCPVCRLDEELRGLFDIFLKSRGNLKQVQRELKLSYPTVRQRMEMMFRKLEGKPDQADPKLVLERLRAGEITVDEADSLLRGE